MAAETAERPRHALDLPDVNGLAAALLTEEAASAASLVPHTAPPAFAAASWGCPAGCGPGGRGASDPPGSAHRSTTGRRSRGGATHRAPVPLVAVLGRDMGLAMLRHGDTGREPVR
ncbi:hypothetical protein GCM10022220_43730 [Actinocatenispora rupis]